jgi:hypothetical protein
LVTDDGMASDLPFGSFDDRTVYVVDVANVEEDAQDLVFARIVSKLREHLERRDLGVDHVIVFVDELNKYAPHDGPETYVRKMLLDIAERGRYLGLVLFGAEQFRSQVHRRVVGNAGTIDTEVVLVSRKSKTDTKRWVFLDIGKFGGLAETMDEAIQYPIVSAKKGSKVERVILAGPTCDSADVLYEKADYRLPIDLVAGDRLEIRATGAYTTTYSAVAFNGASWDSGETETFSVRAALLSKWTTSFSPALSVVRGVTDFCTAMDFAVITSSGPTGLSAKTWIGSRLSVGSQVASRRALFASTRKAPVTGSSTGVTPSRRNSGT